MTDLLGEALARWEGWQQGDPYDPGTLDQLLAAARNWHTLINHDDEMVERIADAILRRQFPQSKPHILDEILATYTDKSAYRGDAHAVVDALTVTAEPDDDLPDVKSRWYANTTEPE